MYSRNQILLSFFAGLSIGATCALLLKKGQKTENNSKNPYIDHVVIRSHGKIEQCISFYNLLGFSVERYDEWKSAIAKDENAPIFPHVRINTTQIIDLFPNNMIPYECRSTSGNVDHFCLSVSGEEHLNILRRIRNSSEFDLICLKQFEASGAQGTGWSTYFKDPTGLYIEIRNYEKEYWNEIKLYVERYLQNF